MRRFGTIAITILIAVPLLAQEKLPAGDVLWNALLKGNEQYVAGTVKYDNLKAEREQLAQGQTPPITILSCSDSRVPPELIFNQSLGSFAVVRTAGNVVDDFGLGSIELPLAIGSTRLLIVLGHEDCDVVKAALGGADPKTPAMLSLAKRIRSSFAGIPYDSRNTSNVQRAVEANAKAAAAQLLAGSILIRDAVVTEQIKIVTAVYDLNTGEVKRID
jgi:carbonic anhydrase